MIFNKQFFSISGLQSDLSFFQNTEHGDHIMSAPFCSSMFSGLSPLLPANVWLCPARSCKTRTASYDFIQSPRGQHYCKQVTEPVLGSRKEKLSLGPREITKGTVGIKSCVWKAGVFLAKSTVLKGLAKDDYQWSGLNTCVKGFW